jgi:hypothetical protein
MLTRFAALTEVAVPHDVTGAQLTQFIDQLVDEQVRQLAVMYQQLIADLEEQSRHLKHATRGARRPARQPAASAGSPAAIRRRLEHLPARPPADAGSDPLEFRAEPRVRGVYLRLTGGCYRNADMRAYDQHGRPLERECAIDDPIIRLGVARYLWSVLEWRDQLPRRASRGR